MNEIFKEKISFRCIEGDTFNHIYSISGIFLFTYFKDPQGYGLVRKLYCESLIVQIHEKYQL